MAEDQGNVGQQPTGPGAEQGVQVLLDERELRTFYANAYRIHTSAEEVVIDLGFNMPNPNPNQQGGASLLFFDGEVRVVQPSGVELCAEWNGPPTPQVDDVRWHTHGDGIFAGVPADEDELVIGVAKCQVLDDGDHLAFLRAHADLTK